MNEDDKKILNYLAKKLISKGDLGCGESELYAQLAVADMRKKVESSEGIIEIAELFFRYIYEYSEDYGDTSYYQAVATDGDVWLICLLSPLFLAVWEFNNPSSGESEEDREEAFGNFVLDKDESASDLVYEIVSVVDECCRVKVKVDERIHVFSVLNDNGDNTEVDMLLLAEVVELFREHPGNIDYLRAVTESCFNKKYTPTSVS